MAWILMWWRMTSLRPAYPEVLFAAATACFLIFTFYPSWRRKLPLNWPVVGMLPVVIAHHHHLHDYGVQILAAANWTFRFKGPWFLGMDMVFTCNPADVNQMFVTNFSSFPKGREFADIFEIFGLGLLVADGELWRKQRTLIHSLFKNPSFRSHEFRLGREKVEKVLVPLLHRLAEQREVVDLQDVFGRLTFDLSCAMLLGVDPGCLAEDFPAVEFAKALEDAEEVIFYRHMFPKVWWKTMKYLRVGQEKKLAMAQEVMDRFVADAIARRKEKITNYDNTEEEEEEEGADLLAVYLRQPDEQRRKYTLEFDKFIRDNALNLLLAGRDTTAASLTWFFWLLSTHPHVELNILEELKQNWPEASDGDGQNDDYMHTLDRDRLGKLVYLHAALCECLRLYPPVALQHKGVAGPTTLASGEKVNPGTPIIVHLYSMGRMEGIWGEDCMEFKPERWITESGDLRHEPAYKFFAFSCGPRICLGKEMAFTKMKNVVAALLYNFQFEVIQAAHTVEPKLSLILHIKNGLMVKASKRYKPW